MIFNTMRLHHVMAHCLRACVVLVTCLCVSLFSSIVSATELSSSSLSSTSSSTSPCHWQQWQQFKAAYIKNGRIIDGSDPRNITTSEGQSYGLIFALVANDQQTFDQILNWTQTNLSGDDLTAQLPAWLWGRNQYGKFGVLDHNSASDSDLWIAYALAEAGRLWHKPYYQSLSYLLADRILREETITLSKFGTVLLPGTHGFASGHGQYRLNPSYVPLQLITRMQTLYPHSLLSSAPYLKSSEVAQWQSIYQSSVDLLTHTMPKGFTPDWVILNHHYKAQRFQKHNQQVSYVGSYNAIRTYLWAGMLSDDTPEKTLLIHKMQPMVRIIRRLKMPPRKINTITGEYTSRGSAGFSAAILPLLSASKYSSLAKSQAKRVGEQLQTQSNQHYYDNVLALFGLGWYQHYYRFAKDGQLQPAWSEQCLD